MHKWELPGFRQKILVYCSGMDMSMRSDMSIKERLESYKTAFKRLNCDKLVIKKGKKTEKRLECSDK